MCQAMRVLVATDCVPYMCPRHCCPEGLSGASAAPLGAGQVLHLDC